MLKSGLGLNQTTELNRSGFAGGHLV
jgi:hypothetical protein